MSQMKLTVTHTGEGDALTCVTPLGATMTFDNSDNKHGASPMQHLLAALGACAIIDVKSILEKKRLTFSNLRVECTGDRPDEGFPKPFLGVKLAFHVDGDVPQKAFDDAVRLSVEKYCSVGDTLKKNPAVAFEAIVNA